MPEIRTLGKTDRAQIAVTARGLIAETFDFRTSAGGATLGTATGASNQLKATLIALRAGDIITNLHCLIPNAGTGSGVTLFKMALFDKTGAFLRATADVKASLTANTVLVAPLSATYTITADDGYYIAALALAATTIPSCVRGLAAGGLGKVIGTGVRASFEVAAQTDITATVTPTDSNDTFWFACS